MKMLFLSLLLLAPTCQPAQTPSGEEPADTIRVERLEAEAHALAKTAGCSGPESCRTAPVGSRPCGGPRTYLAYCATATDTAALFAKLEQLRRAEERANQASGMISTCEFRMPPATRLVGGTCQAQ